jgi:O-antigen/teichoic acid export membrane protein
LSSINGNILSGIGKPNIYTGIIVFGTLMNILLNAILIPKFGISGAALATGISFALMMLLGFYMLAKKKLAILPYAAWAKTLLISVAFLFIVDYLNMHISMNLFVKIPAILAISGLFYVSALFLSGLLTFSEIRELLKRLRAA